MTMADKLAVTLRRSVIGEKPKTRATVRSLGLRKLHQTVEHNDTPDVRGMLHKVRHLVEVEKNRKVRRKP
jgi:large subunit ribosomal protein L30